MSSRGRLSSPKIRSQMDEIETLKIKLCSTKKLNERKLLYTSTVYVVIRFPLSVRSV